VHDPIENQRSESRSTIANEGRKGSLITTSGSLGCFSTESLIIGHGECLEKGLVIQSARRIELHDLAAGLIVTRAPRVVASLFASRDAPLSMSLASYRLSTYVVT